MMMKKRKRFLNSIIRFIEADPRNYTLTTDHTNAMDKVNEVLDPMLEKYIENPELGLNILSAKQSLQKSIERQFGIHGSQFLLRWSGEVIPAFKDLTNQQIKDLISSRIRNTVAGAKDKISLNLSHGELEHLIKTGEATGGELIT